MTARNYPPGPGSSRLLSPLGFLICVLRLDSDSEIPSSSRFPRPTLQFRTGSLHKKGDSTAVQGGRMPASNMWPQLAVPSLTHGWVCGSTNPWCQELSQDRDLKKTGLGDSEPPCQLSHLSAEPVVTTLV